MRRLNLRAVGKLKHTAAAAPRKAEGRDGARDGNKSLWPPLYGSRFETKQASSSSRQTSKQLSLSLSLTGSSCNSTDTAWSGPSRFFAPPWPNIPPPPTPACLRRPQLAAGSLVAAVAGLLEGRTARSINAGALPADCRRGNHPAPAPAARATLPSPRNCAAARLPRGAMGGNRDLGPNYAEIRLRANQPLIVEREQGLAQRPKRRPLHGGRNFNVPSRLDVSLSGCGRGRSPCLLGSWKGLPEVLVGCEVPAGNYIRKKKRRGVITGNR